jgi:hypothetical protein
MNHDVGLHLVIKSEEEEVDLADVVDQMIIKELCHAEAGI